MRHLAAFDFDGTITRRDTLLPFLVQLHGSRRLVTRAIPAGPAVLASARRPGGRDEAKAALFAALLAGVPVARAEAAAARLAGELLVRGLRAPVVERLRRHLDEGHEVVVVSASPRLVVAPVVRALGVDHVLATDLEADGAVLTGRLAGANVRGAEKVRRLTEWATDLDDVTLWAYGDSAGDAQLLAIAHRAHRIVRRRPLAPWSTEEPA